MSSWRNMHYTFRSSPERLDHRQHVLCPPRPRCRIWPHEWLRADEGLRPTRAEPEFLFRSQPANTLRPPGVHSNNRIMWL